MKYIAAGLLALSIALPAQALSISKNDRLFLGGAVAGYVLSNMLRNDKQAEDPCWRGGWDDGTPCHAPQIRRREINSCPTVTWCSMVYNDAYERTACIKGVHECVADSERIDWQRLDDAYLRGRGR